MILFDAPGWGETSLFFPQQSFDEPLDCLVYGMQIAKVRPKLRVYEF